MPAGWLHKKRTLVATYETHCRKEGKADTERRSKGRARGAPFPGSLLLVRCRQNTKSHDL